MNKYNSEKKCISHILSNKEFDISEAIDFLDNEFRIVEPRETLNRKILKAVGPKIRSKIPTVNRGKHKKYRIRNIEEIARAADSLKPIYTPSSIFFALNKEFLNIEKEEGLRLTKEILSELQIGNPLSIRNEQDAKITLVLSGGGAKGSFEAGAILHLEKSQILNKLNMVCGTSAGALNALAVSLFGVRAGTEICRLWMNLETTEDMFKKSSQLKSIERILDELGFDLDQLFNSSGGDIPWTLAKVAFSTPILGNILSWVAVDAIEESFDLLKELIGKLVGLDALYTLSPIRELLDKVLPDPGPSRIPLRVTFIENSTGDIFYMDETAKVAKWDAKHPREKDYEETYYISDVDQKSALISGAIASSSIPVVFNQTNLMMTSRPAYMSIYDLAEHLSNAGEDAYGRLKVSVNVDGGLRDNLPIHAALSSGADNLINISASPRELPYDPKFNNGSSEYGIVDLFSRTIDILMNEAGENDYSLADGIPIQNIHPENEVIGTTEIDPGLIRINVEYGFMCSYNKLTKLPPAVEGANEVFGSLPELLLAASIYLNTEEIVALRRSIYKKERESITYWTDRYAPRRVYWRPSDLDELRNMKNRLNYLYHQRVRFWNTTDCLVETYPDGTHLSDSWLKWENRNSDPLHLWTVSPDPFEAQSIAEYIEQHNLVEVGSEVPDEPPPVFT